MHDPNGIIDACSLSSPAPDAVAAGARQAEGLYPRSSRAPPRSSATHTDEYFGDPNMAGSRAFYMRRENRENTPKTDLTLLGLSRARVGFFFLLGSSVCLRR